MNCALNAASNSSSFFARNRVSICLRPTEYLDERVAGERLFDLTVERADVLPLRDKTLLGTLADPRGHDDRQWHRDERDHGEQRRDHDEHHQHADRGQRRREHLTQRLLQRLRDVIDIVRDPAEDLAVGLAIEVRERHAHQLRIDIAAQALHRALHDVIEDVALQPHQDRSPDVEREREGQDLEQRIEVDATVRRIDMHRLQQRRRCVRMRLATEEPTEDDVRRARHHLGARDRECDRADREAEHRDDQRLFGSQHAEQTLRRCGERLGLLRRAHVHAHRTAHHRAWRRCGWLLVLAHAARS